MLVAACGGASQDTPAPNAPTPEVAPAASTTDAKSDAKRDAEAAAASEKDTALSRAQFIEACSAKLPAPEYCECSWEQFKGMFTGAEQEISQEQMADFQTRVRTTCAPKLPEDTVKNTFVTSCEGKTQKELKGYCGCAWTELRKRLEIADFAGTLEDGRGKSAKKEMVGVCGKQFPEAIAKQEFDAGCAKSEENKPFCNCAWKVIRAAASPAEIAANMVDMEAVKPKLQASCAKLRK
jgi:cell division septation protein DedD